MPRVKRKPDEIEIVKENIINEALHLLINDGFDNMSMRKLANRTGMTAANIYNYFSSKDEIYLIIQTKGFNLMSNLFSEIAESSNPPLKKIKKIIETYIGFAVKNPDYYDVMFSRNTPKYTDYINTELEPVAFIEKESALDVARITSGVISEIFKTKGISISSEDAWFRTMQNWCMLHGIVSLLNTRVLQEAVDNTDKTVEKMINDMISQFG